MDFLMKKETSMFEETWARPEIESRNSRWAVVVNFGGTSAKQPMIYVWSKSSCVMRILQSEPHNEPFIILDISQWGEITCHVACEADFLSSHFFHLSSRAVFLLLVSSCSIIFAVCGMSDAGAPMFRLRNYNCTIMYECYGKKCLLRIFFYIDNQ